MKADDLGRALTDLAGDDPPIDAAFQRVTTHARNARMRTRLGIAALSSLIIAGVVIGAAQLRTTDRQISIVSPTPLRGDVSNLTWTRVAAPDMTISRIVTANGHTFAVGSSPNGRASIAELHPDGSVTSVDPTAAYDAPRPSGKVNDLVGVPGALVAVGQSASATDATPVDEAWRSTDGGRTWQGVPVESPAHPYSVIGRVLVSDGVVYAIGGQDRSNIDPAGPGCPIPIWKSNDGTGFRLTPAPLTCGGEVDAAFGPNGLLVTTGADATAWTDTEGEWKPHSISSGVTNATVSAIAGDEHGYVAVGSVALAKDANDFDGAIWWSADGVSWKRVVTAVSPGQPPNQRAAFRAVAHTTAGWIAVGLQQRRDDPALSDAILWTSADGRKWQASKRDGGVFEQDARAIQVGTTGTGFAVTGTANMIHTDDSADPTPADNVVWLGASPQSTTPPGILEGAMQMVGGPPPGIQKGVWGSLTATTAGGGKTDATVGPDGRFSTQLAPGTYNVVGHSPRFGDGKYDCPADGPVIVRANTVAHVTLTCPVR